jgi:pimeloyl-ACP methyl ester carboxylesterase
MRSTQSDMDDGIAHVWLAFSFELQMLSYRLFANSRSLSEYHSKEKGIMNPSAPEARDHEWLDYYREFPYFSAEAVRDGCYPRIMEHANLAEKAVVLVHGLSDSPYFMTAIGEYFFNNLKYNVYLPLLHTHGLRQPKGMEEVSLNEWKENVNHAVESAKARARQVAIGGLSTGGTLSFYTALTNPDVTGTLYLFSAALDLAGGLVGELKELLLRLPGLANLVELFKTDKPLIGPNPYRYDYIDMDGGRELAKLMQETDGLASGFNEKNPFSKRVFAAHSESDETASITGIEDLQKVAAPDRFTFYRIPKASGVKHASLVLKEPIYASNASAEDDPLEKANPQFQNMMDAIAALE